MAEAVREEPPSCYGGPLWDPKAKECAGGIDPAFTSEDGGHQRARCMFFESCGTKLQATRMESARNLIDSRNLVRKDVPLLGPARPLQQEHAPSIAGYVERFAQSLAQQQGQYAQTQARPIHLPLPQQMQQVPQQYGYQQMMPVNYQMPAYLTTPEERAEGESFWAVLGRVLLRSIGKSIGHSIANMFDTVPLGGRRSP